MNTTMNTIVNLIEHVLNKDPGSLNDSAAMDITAGWDSLKMMEIVIAIERSFETTFTLKQIRKLDSAQGFYRALLENGKTAE